MEFKLSLLFFQKLSSSMGEGLLPFLRAFSGSYLRTCLICLLHWTIAPILIKLVNSNNLTYFLE